MPIKLAIFDVDGTLLRGDTACLWIARRLGRYDRMLELEGAANTDEVVSSRHEMAEWYSGITPGELMGDMEGFPWAPGVFEGMQRLHDAGVTVALASMGWDFVLEKVGGLLGISLIQATTLDFETGAIGNVWSPDKQKFAARLSRELEIPRSEIAGIGDTPGDSGLLDYSGLAIFVGADLPPGKHYTHLPNADIRQVTDAILEN